MGVALGFVLGTPSMSVFSPELRTLRTPFSVNYLGFDVYDGVNTTNFLGSVEPGQQFHDPTHTYPGVDVFKSDPFFVDTTGAYVEECLDDYLEPYGTLAIDGKVYYAHELKYGFDFGVRTVGNLPDTIPSHTLPVSPLWGYSIPTGGGGTYTFMLDDPDYPALSAEGVLTGYYANDGFTQTVNFPSGATITCSLEPIDIRVGNNPTGDESLTYYGGISNLKTKYGNSKIAVFPRLELNALPSFFTSSYDFAGTLSGDEVTYTVTPGSASIGISGVDKWIGTNDLKGVIPNTLQQDLEEQGIQTTIPAPVNPNEDNAAELSDDDEIEETSIFPTTSQILTGSIDYTPGVPEEVGGFADPYGTIFTPNVTIPGYEFVFDENAQALINNYPRSAELKMGNTLQPLTTISVADFEVVWEIGFVNPLTGSSTIEDGEDTFKIPYAIRIENVYTVQRILVSVIVLTENEIAAVGPTGEPIDISQLTDFQLNQIIKDPTVDIFYKDVNMRTPDWDKIFGSVGFTALIVVVIIIVVSLLGLWIFFKVVGMRFGGGGIGRGGNTSPSKPKPRQQKPWSFDLGPIHMKGGGKK